MNMPIGQRLQVHYGHDYELCIMHYALKMGIDLWADDMTAFIALYSPRQRWRGHNSCYDNLHLPKYQELHRSVKRRPVAALFLYLLKYRMTQNGPTWIGRLAVMKYHRMANF